MLQCHISFYWFFALEVMRGHDFWTHFQMCPELVDLLPVMCQIHKKLVKGELWAEVTGVTIWDHIKILPGMCQVI